MKIGLYFGSFNPIHKGHLAIAQYMIENNHCDELWIVVSPQSPFKQSENLIADTYRLTMARLAVGELNLPDKIKICDIEMSMPRPSWSIDTIRLLISQHPQHRFALVMGEDNLSGFDRWKDHKEIRRLVDILVYPRAGIEKATLEAPLLEYSSTKIRESIIKREPIDRYVTKSVEEFINEKKLYR